MPSTPQTHVGLRNVQFEKPEDMDGSVGQVRLSYGGTILNLLGAGGEKVGEETPAETKCWRRQALHAG